jgi:hypothetical protein
MSKTLRDWSLGQALLLLPRMRWRAPAMRDRDEAWRLRAIPGLPEEQADSQLVLAVTAVLERAEQRAARRRSDAA